MAKHMKKGHPDGKKVGGRHKSATALAQEVLEFAVKLPYVKKATTKPITMVNGGSRRVTHKVVDGGLMVTARMSGSVQKVMIVTTAAKRVANDLDAHFN